MTKSSKVVKQAQSIDFDHGVAFSIGFFQLQNQFEGPYEAGLPRQLSSFHEFHIFHSVFFAISWHREM